MVQVAVSQYQDERQEEVARLKKLLINGITYTVVIQDNFGTWQRWTLETKSGARKTAIMTADGEFDVWETPGVKHSKYTRVNMRS